MARSQNKNRRQRRAVRAAAPEPAAPAAAPAPVRPEPEQGDAFMLCLRAELPGPKALRRQLLAPILTRRLRLREELAPAFAVFCFALALFGVTAPREVALEDDGLFLMLLEHFGVGHPPGYPLYSLLGSPFFHALPDFLSPAYRGHMFSGFAGAVSCVALYLIIAMLVNSRLCAVLASMAYAASEAFWSQAIIAEVYTLNTAMYFIVMALCLRYASNPDVKGNLQRGLYMWIAFTYALSLTNHWPLIGLGSATLLLMVLSQWRGLLRCIPLGGAVFALGLLPYAWFVWRSHSDTALNFYGPVKDVEQMWFYVTRSGYSGVDKQVGVGLDEKIAFTRFFIERMLVQITPLGFAVAAAGMGAMLASARHMWLAAALLAGMITSGPMLIIMLDFKAEFIWFSAFRVYFLPFYGMVAVFFGYGLAWIGSMLARRLAGGARAARLAVAPLACGVLALTLAMHWRQNDRSDYTWARDLAMYKLHNVDQNAHLFTFDDLDLPVGHMALVEGVRPDLRIYNDQGLVFGRRLYSPFTPDHDKTRILTKFMLEQGDPVFYHPYRESLFNAPRLGSDFLGFWRRHNTDNDEHRVILSDNLLNWMQASIAKTDSITDRWTRQQASSVISTLVSAISQAAANGFELDDRWKATIDSAYDKNELVRLFLLWNEVNAGISKEKAAAEIAWIDEVVANKDDYLFDNGNLADLLMLKVVIYQNHEDLLPEGAEMQQVAEDELLRALDIAFKLEAFANLVNLYRSQNRHADALAILAAEHPQISQAPLEFREYHNFLTREMQSGGVPPPAELE